MTRGPEQLRLFADRTSHSNADEVDPVRRLHAALVSRVRSRLVAVETTRNRRSIVSIHPETHGIRLRAHDCFTAADPITLDALAVLIDGREDVAHARAIVRAFYRAHAPEAGAPPRRRRAILDPVGAVWDLRVVRDRVIGQCFPSEDAVDGISITWGRAPRARGRRRSHRRSIRLGSYCSERRLIRVHRVLDHHDVPAWFVAWVVFHELLHAAEPPTAGSGGRRVVHTAAFRRREQAHPDTERARRWLARHLDVLLERANGRER